MKFLSTIWYFILYTLMLGSIIGAVLGILWMIGEYFSIFLGILFIAVPLFLIFAFFAGFLEFLEDMRRR